MSTCTWTGGAFSFDWSDSDNWDTGAPPKPDDDMVVPGGSTFDSPVPPAGTKVKNLTVRGGGLQSRMAVTESFEWAAGAIREGVELSGAQLRIAGTLAKSAGGNLDAPTTASITGATVGLFAGARLINRGTLTTSGDVRLEWQASQNTFFVNNGTVRITSGAFTLEDVIGMISKTVDISSGAALVIGSRTVPTFLLGGAQVGGGGVLRVHNGRLYADATAQIAAGTTLELDAGGAVEDRKSRTFYKAIVGRVKGTQTLTVAGQLRWIGGMILGDVVIIESGVLSVQGPSTHEHRSGLLRLKGSGVVAGPTDLRVDTGSWRIEGDLLLQGPLVVDRGRGWELRVVGKLRVQGVAGDVRLGNFPLTNAGTVEVEAGVLQLDQQSSFVQQRPRGRLEIAPGAVVRAGEQLSLDGLVSGSGRIEGDLEARGKLRPGTDGSPGTLTVDGSLQLTPTATTQIQVDDAATYARVRATGQAFVAGRLRLEAPGFAAAAGNRLDVVSGGPGTVVAGRFTRAQLPAAAGGRYLHLSYVGEDVRLRTRTSVPGFDLRDPPSAAVLAAWVGASPYRFVGYYLNAPCHGPSWNGRRAALIGLGLGIGVFYVGQQSAGASPCGANTTTAAQGRADADDAITEATGQGFPAGSWIYLDVERHPANPVSPGMLAYVRAWVDRMLEVGTFDPGVYLHRHDFPAIDTTVTSSFQSAGRADRARYWVVGGPAASAISDSPARSTIPEATVWQQRIDFNETRAGHTLRIDRDVSVLADPSAP